MPSPTKDHFFKHLSYPVGFIFSLSFSHQSMHFFSFFQEVLFMHIVFHLKNYWSIVDLQCCVSFSWIAKWVSYKYTWIHSLLFFFKILPPYKSLQSIEASSLKDTWKVLEGTDHDLPCGTLGFPWWLSGKESTCQCRRHRRLEFDPWIRKLPWRRAWQPTPVLLPGISHGQRSLVGYSPWGRKEWDMTEQSTAHLRKQCGLADCAGKDW